jgi:hypothetical protein
MDLDKPLDDMIASNQKPRGGSANGGGGRPRQSRERGAPAPYAVSLMPSPAGEDPSIRVRAEWLLRAKCCVQSVAVAWRGRDLVPAMSVVGCADSSGPHQGLLRTNGYMTHTPVQALLEPASHLAQVQITEILASPVPQQGLLVSRPELKW